MAIFNSLVSHYQRVMPMYNMLPKSLSLAALAQWSKERKNYTWHEWSHNWAVTIEEWLTLGTVKLHETSQFSWDCLNHFIADEWKFSQLTPDMYGIYCGSDDSPRNKSGCFRKLPVTLQWIKIDAEKTLKPTRIISLGNQAFFIYAIWLCLKIGYPKICQGELSCSQLNNRRWHTPFPGRPYLSLGAAQKVPSRCNEVVHISSRTNWCLGGSTDPGDLANKYGH